MSTVATIRSYQLRKAGRVFHGKVLKVIPRPIIVSTAMELGLWRKGILVAGEDGADVLADRMIYDKRWVGKSALEHFEKEVAESAWTENERRFARAMRTAYMSLFEIVDTCPGSHVVLVECLAGPRSGDLGPRIELVDLGLSETALPGALLAVRLLDAGGFFMSTGVGFPCFRRGIRGALASMPSMMHLAYFEAVARGGNKHIGAVLCSDRDMLQQVSDAWDAVRCRLLGH